MAVPQPPGPPAGRRGAPSRSSAADRAADRALLRPAEPPAARGWDRPQARGARPPRAHGHAQGSRDRVPHPVHADPETVIPVSDAFKPIRDGRAASAADAFEPADATWSTPMAGEFAAADGAPAIPLADAPARPAAAPKARPLALLRELFRLRVDKSVARVGLVTLCFALLFSA